LQKIVPIILAGGVGTRLWPLSRKSYPKQFRKIGSTLSLFQQTAKASRTRFSQGLLLKTMSLLSKKR